MNKINIRDITLRDSCERRYLPSRVAVLSPITPIWEYPYRFFQPLAVYEKQGIQFECFDCLQPIIGIDTMSEAVKIWRGWLKENAQHFHVFIGFAFGGTLIQSLFETNFLKNKRVILFSSPSVVDDILRRNLNQILNLIKTQKAREAMGCLEYYVSNKFSTEKNRLLTVMEKEKVLSRLMTGCRLLAQADTRKSLEFTPKNTWAFVGEQSRLATPKNVLIENKIVVPGASMRLFEDNPDFLYPVVNRFFSIPCSV